MGINRNVVAVVILLTVIALTSWGVEHRSYSPVDALLQNLALQVRAEEWAEAGNTVAKLERAWLQRRFWLALNNSVYDQQTFARTLTQVKEYITLKDVEQASVHTALLTRIWSEFDE